MENVIDAARNAIIGHRPHQKEAPKRAPRG